MCGPRGGKTFSHCRSKFPSRGKYLWDAVQQWPREFEADQVVALGVSHSQAACAQGTDGSGQHCRGRQRRTGDLEQNLRGGWKGSAHRHQSTPAADIEGSGKLKKLLALFIAGANKHRDGQGQSRPAATFFFGLVSNQMVPWVVVITRVWWHLRGQMSTGQPANHGFWPENPWFSPEMALPARNLALFKDARVVFAEIVTQGSKAAEKCNDLPLCGNSGSFLVDNRGSPILGFS